MLKLFSFFYGIMKKENGTHRAMLVLTFDFINTKLEQET
jgi:hypothetical protein